MPDLLPGFRFDERSGRFISNETGRFVARREILSLLERLIDVGERTLETLTTEFYEGRIAATVWQEQMRTQIKRLHSQQAALGAGGWDRMDSAAWGRVGGHLRSDYRRLEAFAEDVQQERITLPQALNRAGMYAGVARALFWMAERASARPMNGNTFIERRMLGVAEHCPDCTGYYARGWTIDGILPVPGMQSVCMSNCRCTLVRREVPAGEVNSWLGTKR